MFTLMKIKAFFISHDLRRWNLWEPMLTAIKAAERPSKRTLGSKILMLSEYSDVFEL